MRMMNLKIVYVCRLVAVVLGVVISSYTYGQGDPEVVAQIIEEGTQRSQVWDHLTYLSEEIGSRLTGSTNLDRAQEWARDQFESYGLDATLDQWGNISVRFDRGASYAKMVSPLEIEFMMTSKSWSAGTDGAVTGSVIKRPETMEEVDALGDSVDGAWILSKPIPRKRRGGKEKAEVIAARDLRKEIRTALYDLGIAGYIVSAKSDLVITSSIRGWREMDYNERSDEVTILVRRVDYDVMNSRIADGEDVEVEADLVHHFEDGPIGVYNTIAEIRGTEYPDEVVIISGHLDSWDGPGSQGAQDNATGCSTTIEAARILMAAGANPKRTIRFILWSGEEQGLLGSSAYVKGLSDSEIAGISAVFVEDGGTNYIGGVSCIKSMEPMLAAAIAPVQEAFPELPMKLDIRKKLSRFGGSDHAPFVRAGIPGFFYHETGSGGREGKNYTFIHHTQHDQTRYAVPKYLIQSATCSAVLAYNLACADTLLPREIEGEKKE